MRSPTVAIIGGTGFIGTNLAIELLNSGYKVKILGRKSKPQNKIFENYSENLILKYGDISDSNCIDELITNAEFVIHSVSTTLPQTSNIDVENDIKSNLINSISILDSCLKHKIKKFIFISSGGTVYGDTECYTIDETHPTNPKNSYGIIKLAIEKYCMMYGQLYGLDYNILRVSNPYGPFQDIAKSQGVINVFLNKIISGEPIEIWGDGKIIRDYIYIDDLVKAIKLSISNNLENGIYNLGSGKGIDLLEIIESIKKISKTQPKVIFKPARKIDAVRNVLNIEKISKKLQWLPSISIDDGIFATIDFVKRTRL